VILLIVGTILACGLLTGTDWTRLLGALPALPLF
jgi:hypothetical protein